MSYVPPNSFYDVLPNDYLNMVLTGQLDDNKSGMGMVPGGSYPFPAPGAGVAPTYPMDNEIPIFQTTPPSFPSTSGVESPVSWEDALSQASSSLLQTPPPLPNASNVELPTSWDPSWFQLSPDPAPSFFPPVPSLPYTSSLPFPFPASCYPPSGQSSAIHPRGLSQLDPDSDSEEEGEGEETHKFTGPQRRKRGRASKLVEPPYERPPRITYGEMMATVPENLHEQIESKYACCVGIKDDNSTRMKHRFANKHFEIAVARNEWKYQPKLVCPSFVAMMLSCRTAKGGRCDSSERHSKKCSGFHAFREGCLKEGMVVYPLLISRGEFDAIRNFRNQGCPDQVATGYHPDVQSAVLKLLKMMVKSKLLFKGKGKAKA